MKEIHQALISLGPLIATTVFSLRAKEKEDICPTENQDSERRRHSLNFSPSDNIANPELLFRINREETFHPKIPKGSEGRESNECLSTGFPFLSVDTCLRKEEPFPVFIDHLGLEVGGSSTDPNSGHEVVSFRLKDEDEAYGMDHLDSERIESIRVPAVDGTMNRKQKVRNSVTRTRKAAPCKASSGKTKVTAHNYEKGTYFRSQLWPEINQVQGGEETFQCDSGFSDPANPSCHQETPKVHRSETYNDWRSDMCSANLLTDQPDLQKTRIPYSCTECKKTFNEKDYFLRHKRTHMGVKPYQCTQCEKSFRKKDNLVVHKRTHTGERPYHCTICEKSFSQKGVLSRHHLTHMGVRPYHCTICVKSFSQKGVLNRHQKTHKKIAV